MIATWTKRPSKLRDEAESKKLQQTAGASADPIDKLRPALTGGNGTKLEAISRDPAGRVTDLGWKLDPMALREGWLRRVG